MASDAFRYEMDWEKLAERQKVALRVKQQKDQDDRLMRGICVPICRKEYGACGKWDATFNEIPIFVDFPGFGLCLASKARWKEYQGKSTVHVGFCRYDPFVEDDSEIREQCYEIPMEGAIGDVSMRWVYPLPFGMTQFRLNDKRRERSEIVLCRIKDAEEPEAVSKVMYLDEFLKAVKADKDRKQGFRVLMEILHFQYRNQAAKYMVLVQRMHGPRNTSGPARVKGASAKEDGVSDLEDVDKRIGVSAVSDESMLEVKRARRKEFLQRYSVAASIPGLGLFVGLFPRVPHIVVHIRTSNERALSALKDPTIAQDDWSCSLFDF